MAPNPQSDTRQEPDPGRVDEFVALFTKHAARLGGYVVSLVPNWADAEEVLQDTNSVLWKKFHQFTPGTDFFAWACKIARNEVLHYRRSKGRERVLFGDEFVEAVADEVESMGDELDDLRSALAQCLQKLPEKDRRVIEERYREGGTTSSTADALMRSVDAIYKAITRIRGQLLKCIKHELEGGSI